MFQIGGARNVCCPGLAHFPLSHLCRWASQSKGDVDGEGHHSASGGGLEEKVLTELLVSGWK